MAKEKPFLVLVISMFILIVPGVFNNLFSNEGMAPVMALTCPGPDATNPNVVDVTCQNSNASGCQSVASACTLSGASVSFLNQKSPFTQFIQGNIFALTPNLNGPGAAGSGAQNSWSGTHGPFDLTGGGVYYPVNCFFNTGAHGSQNIAAPLSCTQTATDGSNMTLANSATLTNWNTQASGVTALAQLFGLGNGTKGFECHYIAQINYTAVANGPGYTYYGCREYVIGQDNVSHVNWGWLFAMPVSYGQLPINGFSHQYIFGQGENWDTFKCQGNGLNFNQGVYASQGCQNFLQGFQGVSIPGTATTFVPNSAAGILIGFFLGIALFILGLGLSFQAGSTGIGVNTQGTRLAQSLGIGLILWTPMYSEFSTWFTSGNLPYGLDGALTAIASGSGIISFFLTGVFFAGVVWLALSFGGGE